MMKRVVSLIIILSALCFKGFAQNELGSSDDAARIAISPYVVPELNFSKEVSKQLLNKLNQIVTKQGVAGQGQRFILTANASVLNEDIVVTTKENYQYELEINFVVGDGVAAIKFASESQTVKGLGETKAQAYIEAFRKIKTTDPKFQNMISIAKERIIEYYNSQVDFIISSAQALADKDDFDGAIATLMTVPEVCKEAYFKCMKAVKPIYQKKIDKEGAKLLAEAKTVWAAGLNGESAEKVAVILSKIDPSSSSYPGAISLSEEIGRRIKELDQREWDFKLKQHNDEVALEKAEIKAMRDIGVAWGENQQPVYSTNLISWW